jgi:hypothetical protein
MSMMAVFLAVLFGILDGTEGAKPFDPGPAIGRRLPVFEDRAHGVPYRGTLVVDAQGFVREKHFASAYTERRTAASALALTGDVLGPAAERSAPHFTSRTAISNAEAVPGQRLTLTLEFEMKPGHHAYAPGDHAYRALALKLEPSPYVRLDTPRLPPARPFEF